MEFWRGKKVFLTGHTGFKGSWLSLWLQSLGANLLGFSLAAPTTPNLFEIAEVEKGMDSVIGDIRDVDLLQKKINHYQPEIVIHMAAQSLVRYSYQEPLKTYASNVMGTVNLLEAVRLSNSVKVVLNVTSDKCYENKERARGYCETDRLGGHDPYSNSKACAELVTQAYSDCYFKREGVGIATARAGNVIGGGDWAKDRLVPDIIHACVQQERVVLRYPHALRPWQHVLEPLNAYLSLSEQLYHAPEHYSGSWNFGPHEQDVKSVRWIADRIMESWQHDSPRSHSAEHSSGPSTEEKWCVDEKNSHPYEAILLKLNSSKARKNLAWKSQWGIEKALNKTLEWYHACEKKENMREKTLDQITEFVLNKCSNSR